MKPTTLAIISRVADHYEVTVDEILSVDRHKSVAEARQVAMWIVRKRSALSYPEIGREFKRDHTTVMSAVSRIDRATGRLRAAALRADWQAGELPVVDFGDAAE